MTWRSFGHGAGSKSELKSDLYLSMPYTWLWELQTDTGRYGNGSWYLQGRGSGAICALLEPGCSSLSCTKAGPDTGLGCWSAIALCFTVRICKRPVIVI